MFLIDGGVGRGGVARIKSVFTKFKGLEHGN